jgi:hypothetical protein
MQIDVNLNATLEVNDRVWAELVDACDGDEAEARYELESDLEGETLTSIYGEAWVCSVEIGDFIEAPKKGGK